jgi:hypothetical protein
VTRPTRAIGGREVGTFGHVHPEQFTLSPLVVDQASWTMRSSLLCSSFLGAPSVGGVAALVMVPIVAEHRWRTAISSRQSCAERVGSGTSSAAAVASSDRQV